MAHDGTAWCECITAVYFEVYVDSLTPWSMSKLYRHLRRSHPNVFVCLSLAAAGAMEHQISLFLQYRVQLLDGTLVLDAAGKLPVGAEAPGIIRYLGSEGESLGERASKREGEGWRTLKQERGGGDRDRQTGRQTA